ncbi:LOW QUALITY PROTEIN: hydroxyacylglutathione hydrolase-like protein [Molossus nigricans]
MQAGLDGAGPVEEGEAYEGRGFGWGRSREWPRKLEEGRGARGRSLSKGLVSPRAPLPRTALPRVQRAKPHTEEEVLKAEGWGPVSEEAQGGEAETQEVKVIPVLEDNYNLVIEEHMWKAVAVDVPKRQGVKGSLIVSWVSPRVRTTCASFPFFWCLFHTLWELNNCWISPTPRPLMAFLGCCACQTWRGVLLEHLQLLNSSPFQLLEIMGKERLSLTVLTTHHHCWRYWLTSSHMNYFLREDECSNPSAMYSSSCPAPTICTFSVPLSSQGNLLSVAGCSWHLESMAQQMYQSLVETLGTLPPEIVNDLPPPPPPPEYSLPAQSIGCAPTLFQGCGINACQPRQSVLWTRATLGNLEFMELCNVHWWRTQALRP